ncbi:MAG: tetratricopeptide repeat protein [Mucilaginibacter sp.]
MFNNRTRLFIGLIFFLSLILLAWLRRYEFAWVALMMIVLLAWDYIRQGTLVVAARHFHHKEYDKAERTLLEIFKPEWLSKNRRGYYEFLMGGVCLQKQDYDNAEAHYEIAAQYPLRSVNDHVAALVHVANISIRLGNYDKANAYLQLAEKHEDKINAKMKDVIRRLHEELKTHKR